MGSGASMCVWAWGVFRNTDNLSLVTGREAEDTGTDAHSWGCDSGGLWMFSSD